MLKRTSLVAILAAAATSLSVELASAEEQFDIVAAKGEITVVTKGHWHVNKDYPWKVIVGDKIFDKSKFALDETSAKVSGLPEGSVRLKGAVCNGPQCMPFSKDVKDVRVQ